jgi:hypothetical protein
MIGAELINHHSFITAQIQRFRDTGSVLALFKALALILRQHRTHELISGAYCSLFHRPSALRRTGQHQALLSLLQDTDAIAPQGILTRDEILARHRERFCVASLPADFSCGRSESIWDGGTHLIIGEYGESSRIAHITSDSCVVNDHYRHVPGVRHIHSIEKHGKAGEFLVSTGDSRKFLDLWVARGGAADFVRRLSKHLAGFTAAITINGECYFGTDFSGRPNWIETLRGAKYFFPQKAYRLHVTDFQAFLDRYILAINTELVVVGGRKTLSIFDTVSRSFLYCEYFSPERLRSLRDAA